jgi:hypothetical protein
MRAGETRAERGASLEPSCAVDVAPAAPERTDRAVAPLGGSVACWYCGDPRALAAADAAHWHPFEPGRP